MSTAPPTPQRWAIVGGGMLGMTLALRLRQAGQQVTIYERAEELGGLASAWTLPDGTTWDRHYHVILNSDLATRAVLDELDLDDTINWVETKTGCYADGTLYSVSNAIEFLKFPPLSLIDKARLGFTILYGSKVSDWRKLEQVPVERWLRRLSGDNTYESFWRPLLRSKLGANHNKTSAAFIWATIQRLYAARRTGMKTEMFGYVPGGYATIIERFGAHLRELGVEIVLGASVEHIRAGTGDRVEVVARVAAGADAATGPQPQPQGFDQVVVTAASPVAADMIEGLADDEAARLRDVLFQGIVCPSVVLRRPLGDYYTTNITDEWVPFTGVIEMTALVDTAEFGGNHLVYLPRYTTADDEILDWTDAEVEARFVDALARMYPAFDRADVIGSRVSRVRYVLPVPTIGYSERVPPVHTSIPGVHTLSSAHLLNGTLNVNETVQLADNHLDGLLARAERSARAPSSS